MNPLPYSLDVKIFFYDCEVDGINPKTTNITEVCVSDNAAHHGSKFVGYVGKSEYSLCDSPYQKPIPHDKKRYDFKTVAQKMIHFLNNKNAEDSTKILMGYNVLGWDEPVLHNNFERFKVDVSPLA